MSIDNAHNPNTVFIWIGKGTLLTLIGCQAGFLLMIALCSQSDEHPENNSAKFS
jgi:hypothetical protein